MTIAELLAGGLLITVAAAHSLLGERAIVRPLLAAGWDIGTPRWAADRILRFAWHLTTIAWVGIATIALGLDPMLMFAAVCLLSAAVIFVMLRGHLAWPLFLVAGLAALQAADRLPVLLLSSLGMAAIVVSVVAAALHLYWAIGGDWLADAALPTVDGRKTFEPGPLMTAGVAVLLLVFAALVGAVLTGQGPELLRLPAWAGVGVLGLRAIGDGKVAGFTKTVRGSAFAVADDQIFTPLIVLLGLGAAGALVLPL
jgi:hypothetical protein